MDEQIIKYNNIDIDNIELSDPKKIGNIYYSHISYNDNPFFLQTSRMKNIIDIKELDLRKPFDLKFELDNSDMYNCLNKLDENNINKISENSFYWFGKNINIEHSENMYRKITKPLIKNKKTNINFKVPIINEEILCKIYNQEQIDISINDVFKGQECILIVHIRGIKFFKSYYICDYYITHIKTFTKLKYIIPEKCLIEDINSINDSEIIDEEVLIEEKEKQKLIKKEEKKKKMEKLKIIENKKLELEKLKDRMKLLTNEININ